MSLKKILNSCGAVLSLASSLDEMTKYKCVQTCLGFSHASNHKCFRTNLTRVNWCEMQVESSDRLSEMMFAIDDIRFAIRSFCIELRVPVF